MSSGISEEELAASSARFFESFERALWYHQHPEHTCRLPRDWWAVERAQAVADALGETPMSLRRDAVVHALAEGFRAASQDARSAIPTYIEYRR